MNLTETIGRGPPAVDDFDAAAFDLNHNDSPCGVHNQEVRLTIPLSSISARLPTYMMKNDEFVGQIPKACGHNLFGIF
ncbi:hypothetical protein RN69_06445 [Bradyrhizobium japonicum]|nr:hypothetical protein RN69_06445 [Bradyrhizobium japonicum]